MIFGFVKFLKFYLLFLLKFSTVQFELQTFKYKDLTLKHFLRHSTMFHNLEINLFIILYNHYLRKISEWKIPSVKVKI